MNSFEVMPIFVAFLIAQDAPGGNGPFFLGPWMPLIIIGALFYFMLIRPEKRKRDERLRMLDHLKKNDRIVTAGGIYGTVVNINKGESDVTLRIDENTNTRIRVLRSSIDRVLGGDVTSAEKAS